MEKSAFLGCSRGQIYIFYGKGIFFSSKEVSNHIWNRFRKKEVGVTSEKMGFRPQKHDFSVLRVKYPTFLPERSIFLSQVILNLVTNPYRNKKVGDPLEEMGIWPQNPPKSCFRGQIPIFPPEKIHFLSDDDKSVSGFIQREKMGPFHQKNSYLTPCSGAFHEQGDTVIDRVIWSRSSFIHYS